MAVVITRSLAEIAREHKEFTRRSMINCREILSLGLRLHLRYSSRGYTWDLELSRLDGESVERSQLEQVKTAYQVIQNGTTATNGVAFNRVRIQWNEKN